MKKTASKVLSLILALAMNGSAFQPYVIQATEETDEPAVTDIETADPAEEETEIPEAPQTEEKQETPAETEEETTEESVEETEKPSETETEESEETEEAEESEEVTSEETEEETVEEAEETEETEPSDEDFEISLTALEGDKKIVVYDDGTMIFCNADTDVTHDGTVKAEFFYTGIMGRLNGFVEANVEGMTTADITSVEFLDSTSLNPSGLFAGFSGLKSVKNTENMDFGTNTSTSGMFYQCSSLAEIDLSKMNTSAITDMSGMFIDCTSLTDACLTGVDASNVTTTASMFYNCTGLKEVDLSSWKATKVANVNSMFGGCTELTKVNLSGWCTSGISNMLKPSGGCSKLTDVNLDGWYLTNNGSGLFQDSSTLANLSSVSMKGCKFTNLWSFASATGIAYLRKLTSLDVTDWDVTQVKYMDQVFQYASNLVEIKGLNTWKTDSLEFIYRAFDGCTNLKSLDLSGWNTSKVRDFSNIFNGCSNLRSLSIEGWDFSCPNSSSSYNYGGLFSGMDKLDTLNIKNLKFGKSLYGFAQASNLASLIKNSGDNLTEIVVTGWDTSNVEDMSSAFPNVTNLKKITGLSSWNVSNVKSMSYMFGGCSDLTDVDPYGWNPEKLINVSAMFNGCTSLKSIDLSSWRTPALTYIGGLFYNASSLEYADLSNWDVSKIDTFGGASVFNGCQNIQTLKLNGWDLSDKSSNTTRWTRLFYNSKIKNLSMRGVKFSGSLESFCGGSYLSGTNVSELDVTDCDVSSVTTMKSMFAGLTSLKAIKGINTWNTENVTDMSSMFAACVSLETLDVSTFKTGNVKSFARMFTMCSKLTGPVSIVGQTGALFDLSKWDTSSATSMNGMFASCKSLTNIDLSNWDVTKLNSSAMYGMFGECEKLNALYLKNWKLGEGNAMSTFAQTVGLSNDTKLELLNVSGWDTSDLTDFTALFFGLYAKQILGLETWDTGNVTNMTAALASCQNIENLNSVGAWNTGKVTKMDYMFGADSELKSVNVAGWNTSNVTSMNSMFYKDNKLTYLNLEGWDTSSVTSMGSMYPAELLKIKLGENFKFTRESNQLPAESWKNLDTEEVLKLWYQYKGEKAGTYIRDMTVLKDSNIDDYDFDEDSNTLTVYVDTTSGLRPAPMVLPEVVGNINVDMSLDDKEGTLAGILSDKDNINLDVRARAFIDVDACSTMDKIIWTFDVPIDNKNVYTLDLYKNGTEYAGCLKNTEDALDVFTLYDAEGNAVEEIAANSRHTYGDLGYIGSYDVEKKDSEGNVVVDEDGNIVYVHYDYTVYPNIGRMTDERLEEEIYPEYENYVTYNPEMNNYEVVLAPGKYEVLMYIPAYDDIALELQENGIESHFKTVPVVDEDGYRVVDEDGNPITEEVEVIDSFTYNAAYAEPNNHETDLYLTLVNEIKIEEADYKSSLSRKGYNLFRKVHSLNPDYYGLGGAIFSFTSRTTGKTYYGRTDSSGYIDYYGLFEQDSFHYTSSSWGGTRYYPQYREVFDVKEVKAPDGFYSSDETAVIMFWETNIDAKDNEYSENGTVILSDGISIAENHLSYSKCFTCMDETGLCTCRDFGSCKCTNCGVGANYGGNYTEYLQTIRFIDYQLPYAFIYKKDVNNTGLAGACIEIIDKETNKKIGEVTTSYYGSAGFYFTEEQIPYGTTKTFILHEKTPPKYYYPTDDIEITVSYNTRGTSFTMKDDKYAGIQITKYNSDKTEKLGGAEFDVYREDGTLFGHVVINEDGTSDEIEGFDGVGFATGKYYLVETKAPEGYALNNTQIPFEVTDDDINKVIQIEAVDEELLVLPATGGTGRTIRWIWFAGLTLGLAAAAAFIKRREDE